MRTTSKQVIVKLQEHILNHFTPEEFNVKTPQQALSQQISYMRIGNDNNYTTALHLVEGGTFLIYYGDQEKFLNSLDINPTNKKYTDQQVWDLYKHLLAREISKIVNSIVVSNYA